MQVFPQRWREKAAYPVGSGLMDAKELRAFRLAARLTAQEIVDALKEDFPKIDKTIISKCESKAYGVELSSAAERVLLGKYCDRLAAVNGSFGRRKKERRKKTRRVSVRLADEEFSRLQQHLKDAGVTAQYALTRWIENEINSKR